MRIFSDDPEVIDFGVASFRVIAFSQPFWAVMFVQSGALRGAGNTGFPLRANAIGMWVSVGLAALAVGWLGFGLVGAWGAYTLIAPIIAFVVWRRFQRKDWQHTALAARPPAPVLVE